MSFSLTADRIRWKHKTVTRRLGWKFLKPGDLLCACVKCMGLKPGEKLERLAMIRVVSVRREPLAGISPRDVHREGFPGMNSAEFIEMFCKHMKCEPSTEVTRIEFEYADGEVK